MSRKVLIVDDDPDMVCVTRLLLKTAGYVPIEALGGPEGLELAREELPDVILLDIMMPGMDGFEVFRRLKLDPATERIHVVFVTARTDEEFRKKAMEMGSAGFVTKPWTGTGLLEKIDEVTAGSSPG